MNRALFALLIAGLTFVASCREGNRDQAPDPPAESRPAVTSTPLAANLPEPIASCCSASRAGCDALLFRQIGAVCPGEATATQAAPPIVVVAPAR